MVNFKLFWHLKKILILKVFSVFLYYRIIIESKMRVKNGDIMSLLIHRLGLINPFCKMLFTIIITIHRVSVQ